jgi:hypothetical protein
LIHDNGGGTFGTTGLGNAVQITYDPATKGYTVADTRSYTVGWVSGETDTYTGTTVTFSKNDRTSSSGYFDVFVKQTGPITDKLTDYSNIRRDSGTPPVALSYASFGYWTHTDTATNELRQTYMVFGSGTNTMPTTGTASYKTLLMADAAIVTGNTALTTTMMGVNGTASFNVDFAADSVTTTLDLTRSSDSGIIGTFVGTGNIVNDNRFQGAFTSSALHFQNGSFTGGFYGPTAEEMAYAFNLYFYDDGLGGASFHPITRTFINGAVAGAKQ